MKFTAMLIFAVGLCLSIPLAASAQNNCCVGIRGNVDNDAAQEISISDLVYLVSYMFQEGPAPECEDEANIDGSGGIDINDLVMLVSYMFQSGPPPADCGPIPDSVILPLVIGNQLVSQYTEYNSSGQVTATGTSTTGCVGDSLINDTLWFKVEDSYDGYDTTLWVNRDDGAWSIADTLSPPQYLALKYPAEVGDSWSIDLITMHVSAVDVSVTVPAGTFVCYYYTATVPLYGTMGRIWAAPNIGIVKAEQYAINFLSTYLEVSYELESYTIQ
ncbi:MAG TPA: hypothetical protein PLF13_04815 [candidate division Zixibacteria bacterium]|nr:hypothetical protein [candidate division Zixibacteria bacterium]